MANITEVSQWENVIRQLENGEAATGGADGLANIQAKQLANRTKWLKDNYLPLSGGAMSGNIYKNVDNGSLGLYGGSAWNKGAYLLLNGNNKTGGEGKISLMSTLDETNYSELTMAPDGSLGFRPQKSGDIHDLAGSAIVAKSLGASGYVKYASGLIIQWGHVDSPKGDTTWTQYTESNTSKTNWRKTITFPISFSNNGCCFFSMKPIINGLWRTVQVESYGYATSSIMVYTDYNDVSYKWFAIGH